MMIYDMIWHYKWYDIWYDIINDMICMIRYTRMLWYNDMMIYDMIYLTAIGLPPGGSSTVHIYTQTIHGTTQLTQTVYRTT
jgi:hypothetical protein